MKSFREAFEHVALIKGDQLAVETTRNNPIMPDRPPDDMNQDEGDKGISMDDQVIADTGKVASPMEDSQTGFLN